MMSIERKVFFSALGFLAVLIKGDSKREDNADRAVSLAKLIEAFCEETLPELPSEQGTVLFASCQKMAVVIAKILKEKGSCGPSDLLAAGFSEADVQQYWNMAYALAKVELNWTDA
jgi:hypothetical protein